jgi:cytochrome c-type biogenesis protein CcmH
VVLAVALVIGSGVLSSSPPTAAQRAEAIESAVRCPSCEDLSVAESSAATAVTVRATVTQLIAEGRTDQQIEAYLVDRYGSSIVLDPPARGWSLLVWILPLLGGVTAAAVLAVVLIRRRRVGEAEPAGPDGGLRDSPEADAERRRFLAQSLADADAEYLAGDLSDQDYLALRHRDMVRLASLDQGTSRSGIPSGAAGGSRPQGDVMVTEEPGPSPDGFGSVAPGPPGAATGAHRARTSRRSGRSWWFLGGAVAAFAAALIVAVSLFATDRQPGQSVTGSFTETPQQQIEETLAQAATDENQGQLSQAAQLYRSVLTGHPDNEVALAQLGWLEFETGREGGDASLVADARTTLNRAVQLDPGDYAVRLYLGTVLFEEDGDAVGAVAQYRHFLADRPPAGIVHQALPELRQAYRKAGVPLPADLAG